MAFHRTVMSIKWGVCRFVFFYPFHFFLHFPSDMKDEDEEVEFEELVRMFDLESAERSSSWADMVRSDRAQ